MELIGNALLTPEQTANILGVSRATLTAWRCTRRVEGPKYVKVGRLVRYSASEVQRFILGNTIGAEVGND